MAKSHYIMPPRNRSVDDHRDSFLQNWDRTKLVIDHLRSRGFIVTTTYDSYGRKQILSSIIPITQGHNADITGLTMKWKFIAIEIGANHGKKSPQQLLYKKQIERSGGVYFYVTSLINFYQNFDLIIRRAYYD